MINRLSESQTLSSVQLTREMNQVRQELRDMKEMLNRVHSRSGSSARRRRSIFFRSRRSAPEPAEQEKPKPAVSLDDLLTLLPHLSNAFPQLKNPKVAESLKILSNPAVLSLIQQFLANGGLQSLKGRTATPVNRRERRLLF